MDVHLHLTPPAYVARLAPLQSDWTVQQTIKEMDGTGIRTVMLSVTSPGF